jgi:hypothetical protein
MSALRWRKARIAGTEAKQFPAEHLKLETENFISLSFQKLA